MRLAFFHCMNKYLMRTLEPYPFFFAPIDPLTESDDDILARIPEHEWPFMLKNTSAGRAEDDAEQGPWPRAAAPAATGR